MPLRARQLLNTPSASELPPYEIPPQVLLDALMDLLIETPLTIQPQQQGRVLLASWALRPLMMTAGIGIRENKLVP